MRNRLSAYLFSDGILSDQTPNDSTLSDDKSGFNALRGNLSKYTVPKTGLYKNRTLKGNRALKDYIVTALQKSYNLDEYHKTI